jgi:hypothetical protein
MGLKDIIVDFAFTDTLTKYQFGNATIYESAIAAIRVVAARH